MKNVKGIFCDICRLQILLETMNTSRKYYTSDDNKHMRCGYSMFPKFEYDDSWQHFCKNLKVHALKAKNHEQNEILQMFDDKYESWKNKTMLHLLRSIYELKNLTFKE